ncbi:hypothetical protein LENED_011636 [Lentinula edodes]|uniref:Uncharacterized protein n=1 Tax=Lentinula edodes TaxID=5353 RepID=A0A1Q3EQJ7_LENED|nr:hypothetical protein LENED_011636 [Lentinula edodes]
MPSSPSKAPTAAGPSRLPLPRSSSGREVASDGEVEQDQLAFTIESPSLPQLQLFENIFNTGKSLAVYCRDDPLWPILAAVALPCSNCTKHPETCKVPEGSPRCSFCTGKKTCSLGKLLRYRYFARRCNQDLAYSRRFLELHGTPAQRVSWTIPEDVWHRYDELLHSSTSATKVLVELNMLDDQDSQAVDRSELRRFQEAQEQEALLAARRKRVNASPPPKVRSKKRRLTKVVEEPVIEEVPRLVRLVIPPSRPAPSAPGSAPSTFARSSAALPLTSVQATGQLGSVQGPSPLARLADLVDQQTDSQAEASTRSLGPGSSPIKASLGDSNLPKMSPVVRPPLVPRILSQHPYRVENERLAARIRLLESQLVSSRQENATLTSALRDTSVSLEARQGELDQLRESVSSAAQQQELYDRLLDQVQTLKRALPGPPNESLVDRFRGLEEDLRLAKYLSRFESSNRRNEELETSLIQQQSLVDESNALAVRQRKKIETLQEEVHLFRERALFAEKMIREYPDEGSYSVSLPPLAEVQGDLNDTLASLRRVSTFAHRLYRCDPASVLHQHNRYVGVIIDAVISFLRRGLDTSDEDVLARNFQLALQYLEAAHFIHAELHLRSLSSIQWFFANAAEREEGIYRLILAHSRFSDDAPFLNVAQHAGFVAPFDDSLEPPLHRRMFALDTALPHHGAGNWEDLVPALPSLDRLTQEWEAMMSSYIRFVTDTPLPPVDLQEEGSADHEEVSVLQEGESGGTAAVPLFLPDSLSATPVASAASPSPLPPRFGSVANLAIDMTADEDEEDIYESSGSVERRNRVEGNPGGDDPMEGAPVGQGQ